MGYIVLMVWTTTLAYITNLVAVKLQAGPSNVLPTCKIMFVCNMM